jgi:uncharacterized membrane protein/xanthosine utilization system XapX-like protein
MNTQLVFHILLYTHIAAGFTAFLLAPVALSTVKGGRNHRRAGKIYFWGMAWVAATALLIAATPIHPNPFLALVAIFSFYAAYSGYRVLYQKRPAEGEGPKWFDWMAAGFTGLAGIGLLVGGILKLDHFFRVLGPVAPVFGLVGIFLSGRSILTWVRPSTDKNNWWYTHMNGMLTSYIAALTAFSATNFPRWMPDVPIAIIWLWPTLIGAPATAIWISYYRRKFNAKNRLAAA